jgi:SAM-dependent methyltransferase
MHMLYHVPDQSQAIAAMHRVLKPGEFLAVTTNGAGNLRKMYELTTVFGSPPHDPGGAAFGHETAERLMQGHFGNVSMKQHPARLRVTEPEDVFLALTSYPPGDEAQLDSFRDAITEHFG